MRDITMLVIHHSASPRATTLEQLREWHTQRGFTDLGYHFVIEGTGITLRGRPVRVMGAHVHGHNENSIGVCVTGDNTTQDQKWTDQQKIALGDFVRKFRLFWPVADVVGHRDLAATLCPGLDVKELLQGLGALPGGEP